MLVDMGGGAYLRFGHACSRPTSIAAKGAKAAMASCQPHGQTYAEQAFLASFPAEANGVDSAAALINFLQAAMEAR